MTRIADNGPAGARSLFRHAKAPATFASKSKRGWCCFCHKEGSAGESKQAKMLRAKPPAPAASVPPVSSGEAGSAPRIAPVPALGPVSEARAFPKPENAYDFRHWR